MSASTYGARMNYQSLVDCKPPYPCVRNFYPPINGKVTIASEAEKNATLPEYRRMGQNEYHIDNLLMKYKLDADATREHMLDSLWRWVAVLHSYF